MGKDDVRCRRGQFRRMSANVRGIRRGPARVDAQIAANVPAQKRHGLMERGNPSLKFGIVCRCGHKDADTPDPFGLLCPYRERPRRRRTAKNADELAPPHRHSRGQGRQHRIYLNPDTGRGPCPLYPQ
jgi:hypothetical protein